MRPVGVVAELLELACWAQVIGHKAVIAGVTDGTRQDNGSNCHNE